MVCIKIDEGAAILLAAALIVTAALIVKPDATVGLFDGVISMLVNTAESTYDSLTAALP